MMVVLLPYGTGWACAVLFIVEVERGSVSEYVGETAALQACFTVNILSLLPKNTSFHEGGLLEPEREPERTLPVFLETLGPSKKVLVRGVDPTKASPKDLIVVGAPGKYKRAPETETDPDDVIDLGAPRRQRTSPPPRLPRLYTPNPRLYPGLVTSERKRRTTRSSETRPKKRGRKRKFTRPVPNSRLYRPAPARPPPPSARPRVNWPAPTSTRGLDTASRAALRVLQARRLRPIESHVSPVRAVFPAPPSPSSAVESAVNARRLVVTLPAAESGDAARYLPASEHFRLRERPSLGSGASTPPAARPPSRAADCAVNMAATNKNSTSPDCSDGNDASSAPSEFLAEFLSAIMRRQYAEALKYCQLILQYEPHNSTARGFYPLLQHKLHTHTHKHRNAQKKDETSSSEDTSPRRGGLPEAHLQKKPDMEGETEGEVEGEGKEMEQGADGSDSACSSLELDSDEPSPPSPSPHTPRRSDRDNTDPADTTDPTDPSDSASWRWESGGEKSDRDDNGNRPHTQPQQHALHQGAVDDTDVENDNALVPTHSHLKSDSLSSLQRLRAQFTCSIK